MALGSANNTTVHSLVKSAAWDPPFGNARSLDVHMDSNGDLLSLGPKTGPIGLEKDEKCIWGV